MNQAMVCSAFLNMFDIYIESKSDKESTIILPHDYVDDDSLELVLTQVKEPSLQEYIRTQVDDSNESK